MIIDAYRAGVPGNGSHFPDDAKMAKIHWNAKQSADAPSTATALGMTLSSCLGIAKDFAIPPMGICPV